MLSIFSAAHADLVMQFFFASLAFMATRKDEFNGAVQLAAKMSPEFSQQTSWHGTHTKLKLPLKGRR